MPKNQQDQSPVVIKLLGNEEENFYQLGLKDRSFFRLNNSSIYRLFGISQEPIQKLTEGFIKTMSKGLSTRHKGYLRNLEAYAEGLNTDPQHVFSLFLVPEVLSAIHKFIPGLSGTLLGCSSIFSNQNNNLHHYRILDFPLVGVLDHGMQSIQFQFEKQKVFYHTFKGIPYPSLSSMNESGISLALHQKFNRFFNPTGVPIFELTKLLITEARDKQDIFEILDENPSLTSWGINIGLDNIALEIDVKGEDYSVIETEIHEDDHIYNCNEPIEYEHKDYNHIMPYGMSEFNRLRRQSAEEEFKRNKENTDLSFLKLLSTKIKNTDAKNLLTPQTMASLDTLALVPAKGESFRFVDEGPQNWNNHLYKFTNAFSDIKTELVKKDKDQENSEHYKGLKYFAQAAISFQENKFESLFHNIQMAELYIKDEAYLNYIKFFKYAYAFVTYDENLFPDLYRDLLELRGKNSPFIEDHIELYLSRLETILDYPKSKRGHRFSHKQLKRVGENEAKLGKTFLKNKRKLYIPRPEVHDVIYPFFY